VSIAEDIGFHITIAQGNWGEFFDYSPFRAKPGSIVLAIKSSAEAGLGTG